MVWEVQTGHKTKDNFDKLPTKVSAVAFHLRGCSRSEFYEPPPLGSGGGTLRKPLPNGRGS